MSSDGNEDHGILELVRPESHFEVVDYKLKGCVAESLQSYIFWLFKDLQIVIMKIAFSIREIIVLKF